MTIDTKKLRERINDGSYDIGADRISLPKQTVIALLDEIERLEDRLSDRVLGEVPTFKLLREQLAAMTAARDRACEIAEAATFVIDNGLCERCRSSIENVSVEEIDALRKVGAR